MKQIDMLVLLGNRLILGCFEIFVHPTKYVVTCSAVTTVYYNVQYIHVCMYINIWPVIIILDESRVIIHHLQYTYIRTYTIHGFSIRT